MFSIIPVVLFAISTLASVAPVDSSIGRHQPLFRREAAARKKKAKNNNNNNNGGPATVTNPQTGNLNGNAVTPVGTGNSPACQTNLNNATAIIGVMQTLLTASQNRPCNAPSGGALSQNLNDLATYEAAVASIGPPLNAAAACQNYLIVQQQFANVRVGWAQCKAQTRTAQINAGAPDGTPGNGTPGADSNGNIPQQ
ncbi:hypothetical protein HDV06_000444 [Boothiomyces sp. JEL0866]|nr:hypothetical protein HDV06_000444 [Boothiomyces sp. JEL0866]